MDDARARLASRLACLILGLALWLCAAGPLFRPAMVAGHDTVEHALLGVATADALRSGVFPLPTLPAVYGGMGCQSIQYHCPGFYYPFAGLILAGWPPYAAEKLLMGLSMLMALSGMAFWIGRACGAWGGLLAGTALLYAPYYLADHYWRVALPELVGLSLLPWILGALERHLESGARRWGALTALLLAYLMTLHAPTALMSALLVGAHGLATALAEDARVRLVRLACTAAVAVSLGAVYWLPTLLDVPRLNVTLEGTFVDYRTHFQTLTNLFDDEWSHTTGKGSPLHLGRAQAALALAALLTAPLSGRILHVVAALIALVISVFMCGAWSQPVWDNVAPVRNVFFPWRWLGPASIALAALAPVCAGALFRWLAGREPDVRRRAVGQAMLHLPLVLVVAASGYRMVDARPERQPEPTMQRVRSQPDLLWNHYIPRNALPPGGERPVAQVHHGDGKIVAASVLPGHLQARVLMAGPGTIAFGNYAYPEWSAYVDGARVPAGREPIEGGMLVAVGPGEHVVDARFAWPALRWLSLMTGLFAFAAFLYRARALHGAWAAAAAITLIWAGVDRVRAPESLAPGLTATAFAGERWTGARTTSEIPWLDLRHASPLWSAYTGVMKVEQEGSYRFQVRSDDGAYVFVDRHPVVDCGRAHAAQMCAGEVHLVAGEHEVAVLYFNAASAGVIAGSVQRLGEYPVPLASPHLSPRVPAWLDEAIAEAVRRGP